MGSNIFWKIKVQQFPNINLQTQYTLQLIQQIYQNENICLRPPCSKTKFSDIHRAKTNSRTFTPGGLLHTSNLDKKLTREREREKKENNFLTSTNIFFSSTGKIINLKKVSEQFFLLTNLYYWGYIICTRFCFTEELCGANNEKIEIVIFLGIYWYSNVSCYILN